MDQFLIPSKRDAWSRIEQCLATNGAQKVTYAVCLALEPSSLILLQMGKPSPDDNGKARCHWIRRGRQKRRGISALMKGETAAPLIIGNVWER